MREVIHCTSHRSLAKFRGMMIKVKYGAMIGWKTRVFVCAQSEFPGYGFFCGQSQPSVCPWSSKHEISPEYSSV